MKGNSWYQLSSFLSQFWISLFLKTSSKGNFTASPGRGIVTSPGCADPCTAFSNTCQRKGCMPFSFPQRKSGWAGTCTAYHICLRIIWYCKINTLSTELEKTYPFFQKIKVQLAFFKMLPEFVLLLFKSIARRCVLDVLLKCCCFLIILTFYHYKEHSRIPWTERIMGAPISFECICIMWFFNTFIYSFLPTAEQKEREKHFKKLKKHYEMPAWQGELRARWQK